MIDAIVDAMIDAIVDIMINIIVNITVDDVINLHASNQQPTHLITYGIHLVVM